MLISTQVGGASTVRGSVVSVSGSWFGAVAVNARLVRSCRPRGSAGVRR